VCGWEINLFFSNGGEGGDVQAALSAWEVLVRLVQETIRSWVKNRKGWGCFRVPSFFMSVVFNRRQSGTGSRRIIWGSSTFPFFTSGRP
jgi:hypothetical protein